MAIPKGVWGIDIGQCALKALRVEMIDGQPTATAFDYVEHPKILSQPDADPDQLTREALDQFLSRNSLKGDLVAVAVPGQSGLARFVKLPPVEEKKIGDIVRFEAKQQIPFPLEEVVWDYQKIGAGQVTDGFAMETEIGLFAMKRDIIARQLQHYREVGIEVDIIQMSPLALCNFVAWEMLGKGGAAVEEADDDTPRGKRKCVVALDVGADASNLVVTDGDKVIWQRPIPLGGNHLTRALAKELKLTFAKAEHLKRNAAKSPPDLKQILAALKPVLTDLVGEVQRSLGFFTNSHREAHVAYLVALGSAFKLPGLQKYLGEKLQIDVKKPSKFARLYGDEVAAAPVFNENLLGFASVYGLCVQGLSALDKAATPLSRLTTNLLPPEIRKERLIKAKKPWAIAAAAALFAGMGLMTTGYAWSHNAVNNSTVEKGLAAAKSAVQAVNNRRSEVESANKKLQETTDAVNSIVAGKDEQLNWIELLEFVNRALPAVDGSNLECEGKRPRPGELELVEEGKKKTAEDEPRQTIYWREGKARDAKGEYLSRVQGLLPDNQPMSAEFLQNLCHVDVESMHTYYTANLKQFIDNVKADKKNIGEELEGMLSYDKDKPPSESDAGWVVALHGVSYHKDGRIFVRDTVLYNIATLCDRPLKTHREHKLVGRDGKKWEPGAAIKNQISHAFLFNCWRVDEPRPGAFEFIGTNYLKPLVSSAPPNATAGVTTPPTDQAAAPTRDNWPPLAGAGVGAGATSPGAPPSPSSSVFNPGTSGYPAPVMGPGRARGGSDRPGDARPGSAPSTGPGPVTPTQPPPGTVTPTETGAARTGPRYEFVIMFVWKEPTPSDRLTQSSTPNP